MDTVLIVLASLVLYVIAYRTYGRYMARKVLGIDPERTTPACDIDDGVDFVPSRRSMVFGHHFTSIAGTGPIVGPAIAVVWGWVPALVWVLVGSIFIGAVHDLGALVISMRHRGRTIADLSGDVVSSRVRLLFMVVVLVGLWIVLAIFGLVIATIFRLYPQSVLPVFAQIPVAVALGVWIRRGGSLLLGSVVSVVVVYLVIAASASVDWSGVAFFPGWLTAQVSVIALWTMVLMAYVFIASVLPVDVLLQPRDVINAWQLLVAMALLVLGVLAARPPIVAEAVRLVPPDSAKGLAAPPMMPFLFITVACGAISGFHCLVSSGCSSRQLRSEGDAQAVGFGSMLTEGFLAVLVIVACAAGVGMGAGDGLTGSSAWAHHYGRWGGDAGLGSVLAPFVGGGANMIEAVGVPHALAVTVMGVFVASFAATTLDSATRLQRYVIAELGGAGAGADAEPGPVRRVMRNRFGATGVAVLTALGLALSDAVANGLSGSGMGGLMLWPVFGATNQLLAALALLVLTVWFARTGRPVLVTAAPVIFMLVICTHGIVLLIEGFARQRDWLLLAVSVIMLGIEIWITVEGLRLLLVGRGGGAGARISGAGR